MKTNNSIIKQENQQISLIEELSIPVKDQPLQIHLQDDLVDSISHITVWDDNIVTCSGSYKVLLYNQESGCYAGGWQHQSSERCALFAREEFIAKFSGNKIIIRNMPNNETRVCEFTLSESDQQILDDDTSDAEAKIIAMSADSSHFVIHQPALKKVFSIIDGMVAKEFYHYSITSDPAVSDDMQIMAIGGSNQDLRIVDLATGDLKLCLNQPDEYYAAIFFDDILAVFDFEYLKLIDLKTGKRNRKIEFSGFPLDYFYQKEKKQLYFFSNQSCYRLFIKYGKIHEEYNILNSFDGWYNPYSMIKEVRFTDNGRKIAVLKERDGGISCYCLTDKKLLWKKKPEARTMFNYVLQETKQHLFIGSNNKGLLVWDLKQGKQIKPDIAAGRTVFNLQIYHDQERILFSDMESGLREMKLSDHSTELIFCSNSGQNCFTFDKNQDETMVAMAFTDNLLEIWNPESRELVQSISDSQYMAYAVKFSPDGNYLLTIGKQEIRCYQKTGNSFEFCYNIDILTMNSPKFLIHVSNDSRTFYIGLHTGLKQYSISTGKELNERSGHFCSFSFACADKYLVEPSDENVTVVHNLHTQADIVLQGDIPGLVNFQISSDEKFVYACGVRGQFAVWNLMDGELLLVLHNLSHGYFWTNSADADKLNAFFDTDQPQSLLFYRQTENEAHQILPHNSEEVKNYLQSYNRPDIVFSKYNDPSRHEAILNHIGTQNSYQQLQEKPLLAGLIQSDIKLNGGKEF